MGKKTSKTNKKVTKYKFSPKDANIIFDEFKEERGIKIRNMFKFDKEPYLFRQKIEGVRKDDNKRD